MTDEQYERLIALLERIAEAVEARNKPIKLSIDGGQSNRGDLYPMFRSNDFEQQGTCLTCLRGTCEIEGPHT